MARTHEEIDARSLAMHRLVAEKLWREPARFEKVRATLRGWRGTVPQNAQPYLDEWERLASEGMDACLSVATEDSERARALRQCSPFVGILTNRERFAFLSEWNRRHHAA